MKLIRVGEPGRERPAVAVADNTAVDVSGHVPDYGPGFFATDGLGRLRSVLDERGSDLPRIDLTSERIGPPITHTGALVCIGMNYAAHAAESGAPPPTEPVVFFKKTNTIAGPNDDLLLPPGAAKVDWEVELAIVVGSVCRYLPDEAAARQAIAGYAISNDVSERAFQLERGGQWVKGKSCETFNPFGPLIVTADECDPGGLELALSVNGERRQRGTTDDMLFGPAHLVWYLSQFMVLDPGDVINTGTPAGIAMGAEDPIYLQEGDVVDVSITGLGRQRQRCRRST